MLNEVWNVDAKPFGKPEVVVVVDAEAKGTSVVEKVVRKLHVVK